MNTSTVLLSLAGGTLIGLAAALVLWTHGRVAGISGIFSGLLGKVAVSPWAAVASPPADLAFRVAFLLGLVAAGLGVTLLLPELLPTSSPSLGIAAIAGVIVGFGTRMGNGCTSGHGICGVSRLAPRSIVATMTFMATGAITVFVMRHMSGGAS